MKIFSVIFFGLFLLCQNGYGNPVVSFQGDGLFSKTSFMIIDIPEFSLWTEFHDFSICMAVSFDYLRGSHNLLASLGSTANQNFWHLGKIQGLYIQGLI